MVIHHHRRRYVNKLDLSSLLRAGETHEEVRWELYRRKEGREEGTRDQETERKTERGGGQEIMRKRLSSRTHDPGDRIQIYWFLTRLYEYKIGRRRGKIEIERKIEFGGPFGVNGSQGFYDLDSEATYAPRFRPSTGY